MRQLSRSEASRSEFRRYGIHVVRQPVRVVAEVERPITPADVVAILLDARRADARKAG